MTQDKAEIAEALAERLKREAEQHAQEARTANATIAEIYQAVTGGTGEPGNWHGAEPIIAEITRLREENERYREAEKKRADGLAVGWLFINPDTGIEHSKQHPIASGEVPDAESIRPATASNLLPLLIEAWEETERYREAARRSAMAVNTASSRIKELEAAVVKLREALKRFAEVAELDIGDDESDSDLFRPMDPRHSVSGNISIGHLRRAHEVMQDTDWVADKIRAQKDHSHD